jgi:hypothetical protein
MKTNSQEKEMILTKFFLFNYLFLSYYSKKILKKSFCLYSIYHISKMKIFNNTITLKLIQYIN